MRINSFSGSDYWLKLQEQQAMQAQANKGIQHTGEPNNTAQAQSASGAVPPTAASNNLPQWVQNMQQGPAQVGSKGADVSAIGENKNQMQATAADPTAKLKQEEGSAAANALLQQDKPGATQVADMRRYEIEQQKKKIEPELA